MVGGGSKHVNSSAAASSYEDDHISDMSVRLVMLRGRYSEETPSRRYLKSFSSPNESGRFSQSTAAKSSTRNDDKLDKSSSSFGTETTVADLQGRKRRDFNCFASGNHDGASHGDSTTGKLKCKTLAV
ncbi:hypothetical protein BVRB_012070 [Beta vulgaris subsp. vulgaris]|uniref:Uncharacterized protein n=1 Tax=Beta vulgaris subsp. vulgaris TaxID=3555 RepID=A0A0J8DWA4_BETVV|nr:hypothetical protein BVRB_012070 [Beta vulgaris subsp. vulgaris]